MVHYFSIRYFCLCMWKVCESGLFFLTSLASFWQTILIFQLWSFIGIETIFFRGGWWWTICTSTAVTHSAAPRVPLFCSYHIGFDVICDLLLNKRKATWNLFFKWMHTDDTMNPLKCTSVQAFNGFGKTKIWQNIDNAVTKQWLFYYWFMDCVPLLC